MNATTPILRGVGSIALKLLVCSVLLSMTTLGRPTPVQAGPRAAISTVAVIHQLVLWKRASLRSPIVAVLLRGRHFTANGRNASGSWIHGVTDRGTAGWLPSRGFLILHPEVNLTLLPVLVTASSTMNQAPSTTPKPIPNKGY
jgi:hypothetical protein